MKVIFKKISGIYKIVINNKIYIGSSININIRKGNHLRQLCENKHANTHLQHAFNKYCEATFEFAVLEEVQNKNKLIKREQYWMDFYKSYLPENGYNICSQAYSTVGVPAWNRGKRTEVINICVICKNRFKQIWPRTGKKTCSRKCKKALQYKNNYKIRYLNSLIKKRCIGCHKIFEGQKFVLKDRKYCSFVCYRNWANKGHQSIKTCKHCNKKFNIRKSWVQVIFCSKKCRNKYFLKQIITVKCIFCKKLFKSKVCLSKKCCSKSCATSYRWKLIKML